MIRNPVRDFFHRHGAAVTASSTPHQPILTTDAEERSGIRWDCEMDPEDWSPRICPEAPIHRDEKPARFVDGCLTGETVLWLRNPSHGWRVAVLLAEIGGVSMELNGRTLTRRFFGLERVVSFVIDAFPWNEIEALAAGLANMRDYPLRLLPAQLTSPKGQDEGDADPEDVNFFDPEVMRAKADARTRREMAVWENVALSADTTSPTLLDGPFSSRGVTGVKGRSGLLVAAIKTHERNYLHEQGWRTMHDLVAAQRTPFFRIDPPSKRKGAAISVASWYLRLTTTFAPNSGIIRVEVPWEQFVERWPTKDDQIGFVNRISRWMIDARCRQQSYLRMPISLEPIVRAEESLKSLFTPFGVLRNRFLRHAGSLMP